MFQLVHVSPVYVDVAIEVCGSDTDGTHDIFVHMATFTLVHVRREISKVVFFKNLSLPGTIIRKHFGG